MNFRIMPHNSDKEASFARICGLRGDSLLIFLVMRSLLCACDFNRIIPGQ